MYKFIAILLAFFCGFFGYIASHQPNKREVENPYFYWEQLVAKNSKPAGVSQEEFIAKNKAGYCWRDQKYYSEKELKDKAMVHFSETFLHHIQLAKVEKLVRDGGEIAQESAYYCKKFDTECRLWFIPTDKTNQDSKNILSDDYRNSPSYIEYLRSLHAREIPVSETLAEYINLYDSYAIFHNSFELGMILGADCCSIIKEKQVKDMADKRLISGADNFSKQGKIPPEIDDITEYGIGIYYLSAEYFSYLFEQKNIFVEREQDRYKAHFYDLDHFHPISNCGDVLFKPFYTTK